MHSVTEAGSVAARVRLSIGGAVRHRSRLDDVDETPARSIAAIVDDAAAARETLLCGGEPTLRADLPQLLAALRGASRIGMRTDGWALTEPSTVRSLTDAGLAFVVIPMPSARADAHDWLARRPGASRRVRKAIAACASSGLRVEVEVVLTRSTVPHAPETVEAAARLGASAIRFRRLTAAGDAASDFIALSPRLLQLRPLEEAIVRALELRLDVTVEGIPRCFLSATADSVVARDSASPERCEKCPGAALCDGLPADYFARFGKGELRVTPLPEPPQPPDSICVVLDRRESGRSAGQRIVRAAQERPRTLRLVDAFARPDAVELVREALRLDVRVEVAGEVTGLTSVSPRERLHVARVARIDGALSESNPEATLEAVSTWPNARTYAVIAAPEEVARWSAMPAPAFRLAPRGGSLSELARVAATSSEAVREALLPLLPACLHEETNVAPFAERDSAWWGSTEHERAGAAHDRVGRFDACPESGRCTRASRCPGLAAGWDPAGITAR